MLPASQDRLLGVGGVGKMTTVLFIISSGIFSTIFFHELSSDFCSFSIFPR
jgi:hypothetical protein